MPLVNYSKLPGAHFELMIELSDLSVCFIAGTLGQGGAERQLFYIADTLIRHGTRVKILCLTKGEFWEDRFCEIGVPVIWVGRHRNRVARLLRIIAEIRRDPPDLVQSQHFYTNLYASIAARITGSRDIGALRSDVFSEINAHVLMGGFNLKSSRLLAANSNQAIKNASQHGLPGRRLHLLPNVVNTHLFKIESSRSNGVIKILAAGRLSSEKRLDRFLSLLNRVRKASNVEVKGLIAGDGALSTRLKTEAIEMGLFPDHVEFRGEARDMTSVYREADLLVLTSDFEGTPNVILEAMASGLPVVATAVGGVPEIVEHNKTGFLIQPYDESQMSAMILQLVTSSELRAAFGLEARRIIEINHSLEHLPHFLKKLYRAALL
jgi:glycosyltransferase involved in cell wall biosynthesis